MNEEQARDLGRRAVACKGWRWMPGMRWQTSDDHGRLDDFQPEYMWCPNLALPDLTDPATLGCVLALVREAWGDPTISAQFSDSCGWWEIIGNGLVVDVGTDKTEAEALVAALEASP